MAPLKRRMIRIWAVTSAVMGTAILATACSSNGGSSTPNTRENPNPASKTRVMDADVDLTLTGDRSAVVQGSKGTCTIPPFAAPTYDVTGAEYPSLGAGGSISIAGAVTVANGSVPANVKVTIDDVGFLSENGTGISLSRNNLVVTLDAPLTGGLGGAEDINLLDPENTLSARLTGTIRCTKRSSN